ncbi:ankyrin repeat-containing protein [Venturia nashicola]|uniref:Ankyrin repeat-containing protein n=1 Tax=Venturia nashicola TaxID=86259 RepID=A0A4Z1P1R4_9PEZI|nr:ankyrin repeat-containing protein [Venturia nashicola]
MCPIDFDTDGNITYPNVEPTNCAGSWDVLSSQTQMVPIELENLRLSYRNVARDYLKQIVSIHSICKKAIGLAYPDILQSQLLTASRTLNKLGDLITQHYEVVLETSLVTTLEALNLECRCGLSRISKEKGLAEADQTPKMRQNSIKSSELIAYGCLVPLMNVFRALTCNSITEQKLRLHSIVATHLLDSNDMDEPETDVDDNRSILSGNTLVGVQEVKEKGLKVEVYEIGEEEETEPTGCFFRMLFGRIKQQTKQKEPMALKVKLVSASAKMVPKKVASVVAARQRKKACKLHEEILKLCALGTLEELAKLLSRSHKAIATIEAMPHCFLHQLASRSPEILRCVLAHCQSLDINTSDANGRTQLWHAALSGKEHSINTLIAAGANKEAADKEGLRPLHIAVRRAHLGAVIALLEARVDVEAPDAMMNKPLHYAVEHVGGCEIINKLLDDGADINATNTKLSTPLHKAIRLNRIPAQRLLMQRGADIEALRIRWETPVKYAVSHGRLDMLCNLIIAGANPDALTCENKAALHSAAAHEDHKILEVLLDAGCKIDPKTKSGSTPLYMAAQNGRIKNASILASQGADLDAKRKGRTPIEVARRYKNFGVVDVLEKARLGLPMDGIEKDIEDHADNNSCSWEQWFEKYVVATMDWR